MKLSEIVEKLQLEVMCGRESLDQEIERGFAGDLMSDVIANARPKDIWVTMQVHMNVVAITGMKETGAVVFTQGRIPLPETLRKAENEDAVLLGTGLTAFELVGRLYRLGITG
ncbi:MAG: serine kinase [Spirochaetales bacterium]|nr:MAG: serine kinase [Spirochaetales bacterium]